MDGSVDGSACPIAVQCPISSVKHVRFKFRAVRCATGHLMAVDSYSPFVLTRASIINAIIDSLVKIRFLPVFKCSTSFVHRGLD